MSVFVALFRNAWNIPEFGTGRHPFHGEAAAMAAHFAMLAIGGHGVSKARW